MIYELMKVCLTCVLATCCFVAITNEGIPFGKGEPSFWMILKTVLRLETSVSSHTGKNYAPTIFVDLGILCRQKYTK